MKPVTAIFNDSNYATVSGLWQWDYGQTLRIQGLKLPTAVEVHFSLDDVSSVSRVGISKDGITEVPIPDSMFENGNIISDYTFFAYIYLTNEESGQTIKKINLLVKGRAKPEAFDTQEEELFREAIALINKKAIEAENSSKLSESWAVGETGIRDGEEQDNSKYYAEESKRLLGLIKDIYDYGNVDGGTFDDWKE